MKAHDNAKGMVSERTSRTWKRAFPSSKAPQQADRAMQQIDSKKGPMGLAIYDDETAQNLRDICAI